MHALLVHNLHWHERYDWLMVSLFYGIDQRNTSLYNFPNPEISQFNLSNLEGISIIAQLSNTLKWLHNNKSLHNDIKSDNVMVTKDNMQFHAILIVFGKTCSFENAKRKELSEELKAGYREKNAHIAPEIIEGKASQNSHQQAMFMI